LASGTVVCNFHHAIAIDWKSVVAGCCNVSAEDRKTFRLKRLRLGRPQVKHWLPGRAEKVPGKRQQVRGPRANRYHNEMRGDSLPIAERDAAHDIAAFVQLRKRHAFA